MSKLKPKDFSDKINSTEWSKHIPITIAEDEIFMFCFYTQYKAISIELIHHLLGGLNMDYQCMNIEESFQCFKFCAHELMDYLKETKEDIKYFEHRKNSNLNILAVRTRQPKSSGFCEYLILIFKCAI